MKKVIRINKAMTIRRLTKLVTLLRGLPAERFNYATWVGSSWRGRQDLSCGTTACALGWATQIPELRNAGLRLRRQSNFWGEKYGTVCLGKLGGSGAAARAFGIPFADAEFLFYPSADEHEIFHRTSPDGTASAKQVARHIELYVNWVRRHKNWAKYAKG